MSTALPSDASQLVGLPNQPPTSPSQTFLQTPLQQQQQLQAQNMFRQKQFMAQKQQQQQQMMQQQHQLLQQSHLYQNQKQHSLTPQQLQQQLTQQQHQQQLIQQHLLQQQQQLQQQQFHQQQRRQSQISMQQQQASQTPQSTASQLTQQQQQHTPQSGTLHHQPTPVMSSPTTMMPMKIDPQTITALETIHTSGQAVLRLVQFVEQLTPTSTEAVDYKYWANFTDNFFTPESHFKMDLSNSKDNEIKSFEMNMPVTTGFFQTQYLCGVASIQMTLGKTEEYILAEGVMHVECPRASLLHRYENGTLVISSGPLWAQFVMTSAGVWKINHMEFKCKNHEEYVTKSNIKTGPIPNSKKKAAAHQQSIIPESPISKWSLPTRVVHYLENANVASEADEVVFHSIVTEETGRESMRAIALDYIRGSIVKNEKDDTIKHQLTTDKATPHVASGGHPSTGSPIVKTQKGRGGQQQQQPFMTPLQQQAALRQQQQLLQNLQQLQQQAASPFRTPRPPPASQQSPQVQQGTGRTSINNGNSNQSSPAKSSKQSKQAAQTPTNAATTNTATTTTTAYPDQYSPQSPVSRKRKNAASNSNDVKTSTPRKKMK
ncbi:MAG: LIM-domain binding protein-domain-containing protein [Benjaminiella poitrasii]|nr:MAG: LIM-domain binding protein-domain-containing protein [Benjaminiella poitrasii]